MSSAVILLVLASLIAYLLSRPKKLNLPIMGKPNEKFYGDVLLEGVAKVSVHLRSLRLSLTRCYFQ